MLLHSTLRDPAAAIQNAMVESEQQHGRLSSSSTVGFTAKSAAAPEEDDVQLLLLLPYPSTHIPLCLWRTSTTV